MSSEKNTIEDVAKMLHFFARARRYSLLDKLANPFSFEDVATTIYDALREAQVALDSAEEYEDPATRKKYKMVKVREEMIPAPYIPARDKVETFLELCKGNLIHAKKAAALALAFPPSREGGG